MAKKEFKYEIEEILGTLSERESNDWAKVVSKISWNDNMPQIDIRNMNLSTIDSGDKVLFGKGITLNDIEVEELLRILLKEGYLDDYEVNRILVERNNIFQVPIKKKKIKVKKKRG